jgi:hypothetical protein
MSAGAASLRTTRTRAAATPAYASIRKPSRIVWTEFSVQASDSHVQAARAVSPPAKMPARRPPWSAARPRKTQATTSQSATSAVQPHAGGKYPPSAAPSAPMPAATPTPTAT